MDMKVHSETETANRKARRAAQAVARRRAQGIGPRPESQSAQLREMGIDPAAYFARKYRERQKEPSENRSRDDDDAPTVMAASPSVMVASPHISDEFVAEHRDGDPSPSTVDAPIADRVTAQAPSRIRFAMEPPVVDPSTTPMAEDVPSDPETGETRLYSDLWGGWKPIPPIAAKAAEHLSKDDRVSRADALIEACRNLPGGANPEFQNTLRRLVEASDARSAR